MLPAVVKAVLLGLSVGLRGWSASATSYMLVLIPIVVVVLAQALDERPTWQFGVGATLVVAGVYVGALRGRVTLGTTGVP